MDDQAKLNNEILTVLKQIKELLVPISACFEDQYLKIQTQKAGEKLEALNKLLNSETRRQIFLLLFDRGGINQVEIAKKANTTQPTVSRLISTLLKEGLIELVKDGSGTTIYNDKHDLLRIIQHQN